MKKFKIFLFSLLLLCGCQNNKINNIIESEKSNMKNIIILVNNNDKLYVELNDNISSRAFYDKLKESSFTINASDYGNFEKVGDLPFSLPTVDENISVDSGDLILYQGNKITLYYDKNKWNFTRLGKVIDVSKEELKNILGSGDVTLTFMIGEE